MLSDDPLQSALILANGERITVGDLLVSRYPALHEVFLSACETNLSRFNLTDDLLTLATGFITAGAKTVISTLWKVDDLATALFSIFYYQSRSAGNSPAAALQQAQQKLRGLSGDRLKVVYYDEFDTHLTDYKQRVKRLLDTNDRYINPTFSTLPPKSNGCKLD